MKNGTEKILSYLYESKSEKSRRGQTIATAVSALLVASFLALVIFRFYKTGQLDEKYWFFFLRSSTWIFLGKGLFGTIVSSAVSLLIALALGFLLMNARISARRGCRVLASAVIEFTRGVPTLLFIYFFFLVLPRLGVKFPPLLKIAVPVALSASGVVAEVLRSGVNAVPRGQAEAAAALGMNTIQTRFHIVFPQAFRFVVPSLVSEIVIVVKDTTFSYIVNFPDLMQNARVLISNYDAMLSVYLLIAIIYIIVNYILNKISERLSENLGRK